MTESATRKRATLFMRELGTADAAAGLPPRESEALKALLIDFSARLGVGFAWTKMTSALNAYHPAHRRAKRDGAIEWEAPTERTLRCLRCQETMLKSMIAEHVGSIAHLARAEGAAAKVRAT